MSKGRNDMATDLDTGGLLHESLSLIEPSFLASRRPGGQEGGSWPRNTCSSTAV